MRDREGGEWAAKFYLQRSAHERTVALYADLVAGAPNPLAQYLPKVRPTCPRDKRSVGQIIIEASQTIVAVPILFP